MNENSENITDNPLKEDKELGEDKASPQISDASSPKTPEQVAKDKKEFNNSCMNANGNVATNQQIIQHAYFYGENSNQTFGLKEIGGPPVETGKFVAKKYDLSNETQFAEFGETYKGGEHFAAAVVMCVFEYVLLDDLQNLKSKLLQYLPKSVNEEGKEITINQNSYLSINNILSTINGKLFTTETGEKCIGLGNSRSLALNHLWEQFPSIRENIAKWLLDVSEVFEYRTSFDTVQVSNAFVNIIKLDFNAGVRHIFSRLYSNPNNSWLLGAIGLELFNDNNFKAKILPILKKWVSSASSWTWKSACFIYSYTKADDEDASFDDEVYKCLERRLSLFNCEDSMYIGLSLISSERLRTLVSLALCKLSMNSRSYEDKLFFANVYMEFLKFGYYTVSKSSPALPLIACDTKNQQYNVQPLIELLLQRYNTRRILFGILEAYLKEISSYEIENHIVNHIKAFWGLNFELNPRHRNDIFLFLQRCDCNLAEMVLSFLYKNFK